MPINASASITRHHILTFFVIFTTGLKNTTFRDGGEI